MNKYYIDFDNHFDAETEANSPEEAIRNICPNAKQIKKAGVDGSHVFFDFVDEDGDFMEVRVEPR